MTSLVFFGSGPVAAESLRLLQEDFKIEAVITKPTTRGEMLRASNSTPVLTAASRDELDTLIEQNQFSSTVGVLIDFGIIISQKTIDYFDKGIINSHFSLLPELRGADPISFAILNGAERTGVGLMLLVKAMDEGPLIGFGECILNGTETTPELTHNLVVLSHSLLTELLDEYLDGVIVTGLQSGEASYTRKLTKADGNIDWHKPAAQIEREVRAFIDWPKSHTSLGGIDCLVTKSSVLEQDGPAGKQFIHKKQLAIYCREDSLLIELIKPAGKKEMSSQAFLAGYRNRLDF